jgi:hypothetical protein
MSGRVGHGVALEEPLRGLLEFAMRRIGLAQTYDVCHAEHEEQPARAHLLVEVTGFHVAVKGTALAFVSHGWTVPGAGEK